MLVFQGAVFVPAVALAVQPDNDKKINICHATGSERKPWEAINISKNAWDAHEAHGDFIYSGPLDKKGKPTKDGNRWCENNASKLATIYATKIICESETDLPNWGDGNSQSKIDKNTAQDFVDKHPNCRIEPSWTFEWAPDGTKNPGDNIAEAGGNWVTFKTGSAKVVTTGTSKVWVREQANPDYIPFTGDTNPSDGWQDESAEMYCHTDIFNYDNYDRVENMKARKDYYCVAFNVKKEVQPDSATVKICKTDEQQNPLSNWTMMLLGDKIETVNVLPDGKNYSTTNSLEVGPYVLLAKGSYIYRPNNPTASTSDAAYSLRLPTDPIYLAVKADSSLSDQHQFLPWVKVNNFSPSRVGWLGIQVNESYTDWGSIFNPLHVYAHATSTNEAGQFSFRILDDIYGDNSGSINVEVYSGYAGLTDESGCVTFTDVPLGTYNVDEIMQSGWEGVSGLGSVVVDEANETFSVVNRDTANICTPSSGNIVSDEETMVASVRVGDDPAVESNFNAKLVTKISEIQTLGETVWDADVEDADAKWVWSEDPYDADWQTDKWVTFSRDFEIDAKNGTLTGNLKIATDNSYTIWVNEELVGGDSTEDNHSVADSWDVSSYLKDGSNNLKIEVRNWAGSNLAQEQNPGGLLYNLSWIVTCDNGEVPPPVVDGRVSLEKSGEYNTENGEITFKIDWEVLDGPVTDFVITDVIPEGLTFVSADNGGTLNENSVVWNLGNTGIGNGTISFVASLDAFTNNPNLKWASDVLENNQGKRKDGLNVLVDRSNPEYALGAAQTLGEEWDSNADNSLNNTFFSLGFGGSIVLTFDGTIFNGDGADLKVYETTFAGNPNYPIERVHVDGWDADKGEWVSLGDLNKDGAIDFGSNLRYTTAIKLTDISNVNLFGKADDGYDVDAVEAYNILPSLCGVDNTASFTAKTNGKDLEGSADTNVVVNQYCDKPDYSGESTTPPNGDDQEDQEEGDGSSDITPPNGDGQEEGDTSNENENGNGNEENGSSNNNDQPTSNQSSGSGRRHGVRSFWGGSVSGNSSGSIGEVLGASTDGSLMCEPYLKTYIKAGAKNDPEEVKKLQIFLNQFFEVNNPVTGFYGPITQDMVNKFQTHQEAAVLTPWSIAGLPTNGPTGYVYKTTQRWINILKCPELITSTPVPPLP
ncbi:MAG: hypothetical protein GX627_00835 [Parcubacteria group bacterium]|nr:hypothetical protein [Parcubacteria group bacterium]